MEMITLQTLKVQLNERLAQPDYWSLVAGSGNAFFLIADGLSAIEKMKSNIRSNSWDEDQDGRDMLMH